MNDSQTSGSETIMASLGAILSLTTGRMLGLMDEVWSLQNFLAGRELMTHERTLAFEAHQKFLLKQHPELAEAFPDDDLVTGTMSWEERQRRVEEWVRSVARHVGWDIAEVQIPPGGRDEHSLGVDPGAGWANVLQKMIDGESD